MAPMSRPSSIPAQAFGKPVFGCCFIQKLPSTHTQNRRLLYHQTLDNNLSQVPLHPRHDQHAVTSASSLAQSLYRVSPPVVAPHSGLTWSQFFNVSCILPYHGPTIEQDNNHLYCQASAICPSRHSQILAVATTISTLRHMHWYA